MSGSTNDNATEPFQGLPDLVLVGVRALRNLVRALVDLLVPCCWELGHAEANVARPHEVLHLLVRQELEWLWLEGSGWRPRGRGGGGLNGGRLRNVGADLAQAAVCVHRATSRHQQPCSVSLRQHQERDLRYLQGGFATFVVAGRAILCHFKIFSIFR